MTNGFFDTNYNVDSEAEVERRRSFIERMERKLERKEAKQNDRY